MVKTVRNIESQIQAELPFEVKVWWFCLFFVTRMILVEGLKFSSYYSNTKCLQNEMKPHQENIAECSNPVRGPGDKVFSCRPQHSCQPAEQT